jgi:hypothetical protein
MRLTMQKWDWRSYLLFALGIAVAGARTTHRFWHMGWEGLVISAAIILAEALLAVVLIRVARERPQVLLWLVCLLLVPMVILAANLFWRTGDIFFLILVGALLVILTAVMVRARQRPKTAAAASPPAGTGAFGMTRISSPSTVSYKRFYSALYVGLPLTGVLYLGLTLHSHHAPPNVIMPFLGLPLLLSVFGYWAMTRVLKVADEVLDAGNALLVRRGGQEERIAFSDIKTVSYEPGGKTPANITLSTRLPTVFGSDRITFFAPQGTSPDSRQIFDDLTDRTAVASHIY